MSKEIVAVYNEKVNDHQPPFDIYNGMHIPHFDTPERAKAIITALSSLKDTDDVEIVEPKEFGMPFIYSVHDEEAPAGIFLPESHQSVFPQDDCQKADIAAFSYPPS